MDFLSFYWRDVLDIALVTLLLYRILLLIRGTRAFSALIGLVVLVAVYALSHFIGLYSLSWLLENLFGSLFLVIVILFHDDIRQALAAMGTQYLSWKKRPAPSNMSAISSGCANTSPSGASGRSSFWKARCSLAT